MLKTFKIAIVALSAVAAGCASSGKGEAAKAGETITSKFPVQFFDDLKFGPMDPEHAGGPEIARVHGDMKTGPFAFVGKVKGPFENPMHGHDADYHAVIVTGEGKHWGPGGKDDAKTVGAGSAWYQPKGQWHRDACSSDECLFFVWVDGPMTMNPAPEDAQPAPEGEGYKVVDVAGLEFGPLNPEKPDAGQMAVMWGNPKEGPSAMILKFPAGQAHGMHSHTAAYHAVVLDGETKHWFEAGDGTGVRATKTGDFWYQKGGEDHNDMCTDKGPCTLFIYMHGPMDFHPPKG